MRVPFLSLAVLVLAACSQGPAAEQESADDFASRIGQTQIQQPAPVGMAPDDPAQADPNAPNTASATPPEGADVTQLQQLGDIGGVNLGPRNGACTFTSGGREMMIAAGLNEPTLPGKAVIRVGGGLTMLDTPPGGLAVIKAGSRFSGEGVTVQIAPAAGEGMSRPANAIVTDASGKNQTYSGEWICA